MSIATQWDQTQLMDGTPITKVIDRRAEDYDPTFPYPFRAYFENGEYEEFTEAGWEYTNNTGLQLKPAAVPEPVAPEPVAPEPVAPEPVAPEPVAPEPAGWSVGDIVRIPLGRVFRVWRVVGVFLGGVYQEDVIELETLDRAPNTQGRMCVPVDLLNEASIIRD